MRKPSPGSPMIASAGQPHIVVLQARERVRRDRPRSVPRPATDVGGDDERRQPARAFAFAGAREGRRRNRRSRRWKCRSSRRPAPIRCRRASPRSACWRRPTRIRGSVIAKAAIAVAARDLRQPFALLLDRPEQRDRARAEALHREGEVGEAASGGRAFRGRWRGCARRAGCSPSATHSLRKPAAPSSRTKRAAFAVEIVAIAVGEIVARTSARARPRARGGSARRTARQRSVSHPGTPAGAWPRRPRRRA